MTGGLADVTHSATAEASDRRRKKPKARHGPAKVSVSSQPESYARAFNRLCHVLPLTQTGKVREVVDSLVLTCFGVDQGLELRTAASVVEALDAYFGLELDTVDVQLAIDRLVTSGQLVSDRAGTRFLLAPDTKAEVEQRIEDGQRLEKTVRDEWTAELRGRGLSDPDAENLWACLRAYMAKAFCQHGALTVELLDPAALASPAESAGLRSLLDAAIEEMGSSLNLDTIRREVSDFFETSNAERSRYVAQLLDATFTFFALQVDNATASYLRDRLKSLKLFLDTNFIFGLLDLHVNPMREISKELIAFIKAQGFPYTLHYHERTLKEFHESVDRAAERLRSRRWSSSLSGAACRSPQVTGIELAYHALNAETPTDVDVFLSKFNHVEELLGDYGVKLYRVASELPTEAEQRALLVAEYLEYANDLRPDRPKPYVSADHDMAVLMTLEGLRQRGKSILDVGALFVSVDVRLWRFDLSQRRVDKTVPAVVLPPQLLQLLRPFSRSTDDFDQRFIQAFAIPEFRAAHGDYQKTTSMALSYLALYRDVPEQTAMRILTDELLLGRLKGMEENSSEFSEVMELALVDDHLQIVEEYAALKIELSREKESRNRDMAETEVRVQEQARQIERVSAEVDSSGPSRS
jgi:hypothetical protein